MLARTTATLHQFLLNGVGFGMLPSFVVEKDLKSGKLVRVLEDFHDLKIPLYAVYVDKKYMPLNLKALLDFLKKNPFEA